MDTSTYLLFAAAFGTLAAFIGRRFTQKIAGHWPQVLARAGIIAVAVTPTFFGHAGLVPAFVMLFQLWTFLYGILPITFVWLVLIPIVHWASKQEKPSRREPV